MITINCVRCRCEEGRVKSDVRSRVRSGVRSEVRSGGIGVV